MTSRSLRCFCLHCVAMSTSNVKQHRGKDSRRGALQRVQNGSQMAWHQSFTGLTMAAEPAAQKLELVTGSRLPSHHLTPACPCLNQAQGIMRSQVGLPLKM